MDVQRRWQRGRKVDREDHSLRPPKSKITIINILICCLLARHWSIYIQRGRERLGKRKQEIKSLHQVANLFFLTLIQTSVNPNAAFSKPKDHGMPVCLCLFEITGFATELRQSCHHGFPAWVFHSFHYLFSHIYISAWQKHLHPPIHNPQTDTTTSKPYVRMEYLLFAVLIITFNGCFHHLLDLS